jgi:hypothetical protein
VETHYALLASHSNNPFFALGVCLIAWRRTKEFFYYYFLLLLLKSTVILYSNHTKIIIYVYSYDVYFFIFIFLTCSMTGKCGFELMTSFHKIMIYS